MWAWLGMWCSFQAWLQELWKALKSTLVTLRRPPLRSVNQALSTTLQPKWSPWRLQSVWQLCNGAGHTCHKCPHRFDHAYVVTILIDSLSALSMGETRNPTWYLDSGTFVHMTNDSGILWKIQPHIQSNMIILENGHLLPINEVGSSSITTSLGSLMLSNVYYVPSLSRNILFIQQFYKDTSCIVSFDDSIFFLSRTRWPGLLSSGLTPPSHCIWSHQVVFLVNFSLRQSSLWISGIIVPIILTFVLLTTFVSQ